MSYFSLPLIGAASSMGFSSAALAASLWEAGSVAIFSLEPQPAIRETVSSRQSSTDIVCFMVFLLPFQFRI